jgi:putative molybdopterin biosynthesis protein
LDTIRFYDDTIMDSERNLPNCVKPLRNSRGWSQAELAQRAGISRAAVSAIEGQRLVPSISAALARVLESSVEELFGSSSRCAGESCWAWTPPDPEWRYWLADLPGCDPLIAGDIQCVT